MLHKGPFRETDLARLAKLFRKQAGRNRAQAARDLGVSQTSIFQAEEIPEQSLLKLRIRMIEMYSRFKVESGRFELIDRKNGKRQAT